MLFPSKDLNHCFRLSQTNVWMFFSMSFDSGYFIAF